MPPTLGPEAPHANRARGLVVGVLAHPRQGAYAPAARPLRQ